MKAFILTLFSVLVVEFAVAATKPKIDSVTGSIPRGSNSTSFQLQIKLSGLSKTISGSERYADRLEFIIQEVSENTTIPFSDKTSTTTTDLKNFVIEFEKEDFTTTDAITSGTIYVRVKSSKLTEVLGTKDHLTLDLTYQGADQETDVERKDIKIEKQKGVANEAPDGVSFRGSFKTIIATYNAATSIDYTAGANKEPNGVSLYLFETGKGVISIDGTEHNPDADSDTESASCEINTNAENGTDCVTCPDNVYLSTEDLPSEGLYSTSVNEGTVSVNGLAEEDEDGNATQYIGFLVYQPDGVKRSSCYIGSPQRNYTWTELVDSEEQAKRKDPRCFIATATFGSPSHKYVKTFRQFRDQYLVGSFWGRALVETYYTVSPPLAWLVEKVPMLKSLSQKILEPIAIYLEESQSSK